MKVNNSFFESKPVEDEKDEQLMTFKNERFSKTKTSFMNKYLTKSSATSSMKTADESVESEETVEETPKNSASPAYPNFKCSYLHEQTVYSEQICKKYKSQIEHPWFGKLNRYIMGKISEYLGYKDTMTKAYYLTSNWMVFATHFLDLAPSIQKLSEMKVSLVCDYLF